MKIAVEPEELASPARRERWPTLDADTAEPNGIALLVVGRVGAVASLAMGVLALRSRVER